LIKPIVLEFFVILMINLTIKHSSVDGLWFGSRCSIHFSSSMHSDEIVSSSESIIFHGL